MRGVFDDREIQQDELRHDTELTLGSTTLLLIFFGLVLLCGLCFGLGYAMGRRATQETAAALPAAGGAEVAPAGDSGRPKLPANAQAAAGATQPGTATDQQDPAAAQGAGATAESSAIAAASGPSAEPPQVKPSLGSAAGPAQAAPPATQAVGPAPGPASAAAGSLMVQIAAVSHQEDADVLMSALRRRGYAVAAHREPLDGLIHVRIGPFKTRAEADGWRQKLLNDGYNAIVQP